MRGIGEEIVAGAAGDGHPQHGALRIAHHLDGDPPQDAAGECGEFAQGARLDKPADAAGAGCHRFAPCRLGFVERIDVDRGLFIGMTRADRR